MVFLKKIALWILLGIAFGVGFLILDKNFGYIDVIIINSDGTSQYLQIPKKELDTYEL